MCPSLDLDLCPIRPSHPPKPQRCLTPPARLRPRGQLQPALWDPVGKIRHLRRPIPASHAVRGTIFHVRSMKRQDCVAPRGVCKSEWLAITMITSPCPSDLVTLQPQRCLNPPARLRPRGQLQPALWEPVGKTRLHRRPRPAFHDVRGFIFHVRSMKRQDCVAPRGLCKSEWLAITMIMSP